MRGSGQRGVMVDVCEELNFCENAKKSWGGGGQRGINSKIVSRG